MRTVEIIRFLPVANKIEIKHNVGFDFCYLAMFRIQLSHFTETECHLPV